MQKFLGLRQAFLPHVNSSRTNLLVGKKTLDTKRHEEVRGLFKDPLKMKGRRIALGPGHNGMKFVMCNAR